MNDHYQIDDERFVDHIILEVKSQGEFDKFRKEFIADVDTKPAYQNLRQRVENSVTGYLEKQKWKPELNKNQLRERLRKHIQDASYLENGVERIVDQVIDPKLNSLHLKVEEIVYKYLGIEKPAKQDTNGTLAVDTDLIDNDLELEAVSPDSDKKSNLSNVSINQENGTVEEDMEVDQETMMEEYESPAFEPLEGLEKKTNENSQHSNLSEISGLTSQDSVDNKSQKSEKSEKSTKSVKSDKSEKSPTTKPTNLLDDSQMSQVSSSSAFNINEEAQMPKFPENSNEEAAETEVEPVHNFDLNKESIEFTGTERKSLALEEISDESKDLLADKVLLQIDNLYENETTTDSSENKMEIDLKDDTRSNDIKPRKVEDSQTSQHSQQSQHSVSTSGTTESEKLEKLEQVEKSEKPEKSDKDHKKDEKRPKESSSSKSDKSKYHRSSSSSSKYHHSSTSKSDRYSSKDSRSKDRSRDDKKDGKVSKDKYRRSTSDKNKSRSSHREREDRPKDVKESSKDTKHPKEEKPDSKEQKEKDDHYSAKEKQRKRRSTDHDSSGGDLKKTNLDSSAPPLPPTESNKEDPPTPPPDPIDEKNSESNQQYVMLDKMLTEMESPATSSKDLEKSGIIIKRSVVDQGVELQLICSKKEIEEVPENDSVTVLTEEFNHSSDCFGFPEPSPRFSEDSDYTSLVLLGDKDPSEISTPISTNIPVITTEENSNSNQDVAQPQLSSTAPASGKRIRKPNNNFMKDYYCNGEEIEVIDMKKIKYGDQVKTMNHRMSTAGEEISLDQSIIKDEVIAKVKVEAPDSENTKNHIVDKINEMCKTNAVGTQRYSSGDLYKPRLFGSRNRRRTTTTVEETPATETIQKIEEKESVAV